MPPAISVHNLTRRSRDIIAVDDISFEVEQGDVFAFLGPNGAGKSTTIKMLTTILHPTSGKMLLNGHDPVTDAMGTRSSFGIVFQDPSLDDELTAWENMEFHGVLYGIPKKLRRQRIEELLTFVDLWERKESLVKRFSGGMKRRLEIARGLLHHPSILFLDEPTIGLDPQTRTALWQHLREMNEREGITIFFTTHYMEEAEKEARHVAIIDHGRIKANGTPASLKESTGTHTLEEAFLAHTGKMIRAEESTTADTMRQMHSMWRR